jgi:hypothetical protein
LGSSSRKITKGTPLDASYGSRKGEESGELEDKGVKGRNNLLISAKLLQMPAGKGHGLGAGKVGALTLEQTCDLALHVAKEIALGPDAGAIHGLDTGRLLVHGEPKDGSVAWKEVRAGCRIKKKKTRTGETRDNAAATGVKMSRYSLVGVWRVLASRNGIWRWNLGLSAYRPPRERMEMDCYGARYRGRCLLYIDA